jgi:hypothetical protein
MKIIAVEHDVRGSVPPSPQLLREEAAEVWRLHVQGLVRQAWFTLRTHRAVLEMECADEAEAARLLGALPLVAAKLVRFELLGLRPYDGFGRLFAPEPEAP